MNYKRLREALKDYYGTAIYSGLPMAMMKLVDIERASDKELIRLAEQAGFDLSDYED
jgi:hypothetical protein